MIALPTLAERLTEILPADRIITDDVRVESLSKDFYWYSPVLEAQLKDKRADIVVQPKSKAEVEAVIRFAYAEKIFLTARGSGTGNYGQCVPLQGGIVLDLSGLDTIYDIDTTKGIANCGAGVRLGAIEGAARKVGWELRCYPSTWVKASVGGFVCGGSGGIGSISHGGLRENGTVNELEVLTMEAEPRTVIFTGDDVLNMLHSWGSVGIVTRVKLALTPKVNWAQAAVAFDTFEQNNEFCYAVGTNDSIKKRLLTNFEWPIPSYFTPLQKWVPTDKSLAFFELEDAALTRFKEWAVQAGGTVVFEQPYQEVRKGPLLSDYTWNHTTLWAIKADKTWTYLQCGYDAIKWREQIADLKAKYGDDFLFHMEFARWNGNISAGGIPIVRFHSKEQLQGVIDYCREIGVGVANPHVNNLEESGRMNELDGRLVSKRNFDPLRLLNPGKMLTV